jgi:hypothetical protein
MKGVMTAVSDMTQKAHMLATENPIECGEMMTDITEQDEQDEMLAKFWADYGETIWVDPAEQEELWYEKNFL